MVRATLLMVWTAALVGCGARPTAPAPESLAVESPQLLVQVGHANPVERILVRHGPAHAFALSLAGDEGRLWRRAEGEPWRLVRRFDNLITVRSNRGVPELAGLSVFATSTGTWLLEPPRAGAQALLGPSEGVPADLINSYFVFTGGRRLAAIRGRVGGRSVLRLFAETEGGFQPVALPLAADQVRGLWTLGHSGYLGLKSESGTHMCRLDGARCVTDGPAQGAPWVKVLGDDSLLVRATQKGPGRLWRLTGDGWTDETAAVGSGGPYTLDHHDWQLVRAVPKLEPGQDADERGPPRFLWRAPGQPWQRVGGRYGLPAELNDAMAYADGALLRFEAYARQGDDAALGAWHTRVRVGDELVPLREAWPSAPAKVFSAVDAFHKRVIGLRRAPPQGGWWWTARRADGAWVPLPTLAPALPADTVRIDSGRERLFEAVRAARDAKTGAPLRVQFVQLGPDRFEPMGAWLRGQGWVAPDEVIAGYGERTNVLWVDLQGAGRRFFMRDAQGQWAPLDHTPFQAQASVPRDSLRLPTRVADVQRLGGHLLLRPKPSPWGVPPEPTVLLAQTPRGWQRVAGPALGRLDSARGLLAAGQGSALRLYHPTPKGWLPLAHPDPSQRAVDGYTLLDGQVLMVRAADHAWTGWVRSPDGAWRGFDAALGVQGPVDLALAAGGALRVRLRDGAWRTFWRTPDGWADLETALAEAKGADELNLDPSGRLLRIQRGATSHHFWRGPDGWRPLAEAFPVPAGDGEVHAQLLADGHTLALGRVPAAGPPAWRIMRADGPSWVDATPSDLPTPTWGWRAGPDWLAARGSRQGLTDWRVWRWSGDGRPVRHSTGSGRARRLRAEGPHLAVQTDAEAAGWALWTGLAAKPPVRLGSPVWFGWAHRQPAKGTLTFAEAEHTLDGAAVQALAAPTHWFTRSAGPWLGATPAPSLLPDGVDALGVGPSGTVLLYRGEGRRVVFAFTDGRVAAERLRLLDGTELPVWVNALGDGVARVHRRDDPRRWLWRFRDPEHGEVVYFDDAGAFYADSDALAERVTFRVGDRLLGFGQLAALRFRPDLLEQRMGLADGRWLARTPRDRARLAQAKRLAPHGVDLAAVRPPEVRVEPTPAETDEPTLDVEVWAAGRGVRPQDVKVVLLGAGYARAAQSPPTDHNWQTVQVKVSVPLMPGQNTIEVRLRDRDTLQARRRLSVVYRPRRLEKPTLRAVVLGASQYTDPKLGQLPMVARDVNAVAQRLQAQAGQAYQAVHIRQLCDGPGCDGRPTRLAIEQAVQAMARDAQPRDHLLVFASGHGLVAQGAYHLVPGDGQSHAPRTLVSWAELRGWMDTPGVVGKRMVLLDTCHAGAALPGAGVARRVQQAMEDEGLYMLTASSATTQAFENAALGNGLFTHAWLQGMGGAADRGPSDGRLQFTELARYVVHEIDRLAAVYRVPQQPQAPLVGPALDFTVAQVPRGLRLGLSVRTADGFEAPAARVAAWTARLTARFPGLRVVPLGQAAWRLEVVERAPAAVRLTRVDPPAAFQGAWGEGGAPPVIVDALNTALCGTATSKGGAVRRCP